MLLDGQPDGRRLGCRTTCGTTTAEHQALIVWAGRFRNRAPAQARRPTAPQVFAVPDGILLGMPDSTTIKVSVRTRDALRELADRDGLTFDAQIEKLVRRERRRIIGAQLASAPLDVSDEAVLDASVSDVADASR